MKALTNMLSHILMTAALLVLCTTAFAHDIWLETNTDVYRIGDITHIDLKLGNHGNNHRDFKLASKLDPAQTSLQVYAPNGRSYDLKSSLQDVGYSPKEGYWTAPFINDTPGLYTVASTLDAVMSYAPERAVKSAKTFFVVSKSLDHVSLITPGYDRKLGQPLELIAESNPVVPMGPGMTFHVRLLFKGKPLPNVVVSFVPQGETLREGFDPRYERKTNVNGRAAFEPTQTARYLVVAHWRTDEKGAGYDYTEYSATLTLYVPQICPCCGG